MSKYAEDGVNVNLGDEASKVAAGYCQQSYRNSPVASVVDTSNGNFRGPRGIQMNTDFDMSGCIWSCAPDGIGTKVVITDAAGLHQVSAFDMAAMTSFDLVRWGGLPVYMTSVLDVSSLGESVNDKTFQAVLSLYRGLGDAAGQLGIILLNGETAELSSLVGSDNPSATVKYNWGGSVHGLYHQNRMITGQNITEGQVIVAFQEIGFRSNGISSVRKAFAMQFGDQWFSNSDAQQYIEQAAAPSVLYDKLFIDANGWTGKNRINIHSLIHLTGGSFESKLGIDILFPLGLSAVLDDLWELPEIMKSCADWRGMTDRDLYETWNGGQGALAIIDESDVKQLIEMADNYGHSARKVGRIIKQDTPEVIINSKYKGEEIRFG
ncbi:MAG TPA: hypothetical protein DDY16_07120 [Tenacibaculum sp.]|nr:hypothetical protein [Tenacibaculum sp.]